MRYKGKITHWQDDKGFGFITPSDGSKEVFVHIRSFTNKKRRPTLNNVVTFEVKNDVKGRLQAAHVGFAGERLSSPTSSGASYAAPTLAVVFFALVAASAAIGKLPPAIVVLYAVASVVAFIAYAFDKSAAKKDRWRTQESTLHLIALAGGWPGALIAQRLLRHKSKKQSFQIIFWLTVVLNCSALGWLFSNPGAEMLHSVIHSEKATIKWE